MTNNELVMWACKGIRAEINELSDSIRTAKQFIATIEKGYGVKTTKTTPELRQIIEEKQAKIDKLERELFELEWND